MFRLFLDEVQESIFKITLSFWEKYWKIFVLSPIKNTAKSSFRKKFVYITWPCPFNFPTHTIQEAGRSIRKWFDQCSFLESSNFRLILAERSIRPLLSEHLVNIFSMYSNASSFKELYISIAVSFSTRLEIVGQPRLLVCGVVDASYALVIIILDDIFYTFCKLSIWRLL